MKIAETKVPFSKFLIVLVIICVVSLSAYGEPLTETSSDKITPELIHKERLAIEQAYAWSNYRQRLEEIACYQKFFVNACLEEVHERFRQQQSALRKREINNNQAERNYEAQQRITRKHQESDEREAKQAEEAKRRKENREAYQQKSEEAQQRIQEKNSPAAQQERIENRRKYQKKQQEAEQHRRELERQKQEKKHHAAPSESPIPMLNNRNQGD